jgi:hypothetical protein
MSYRLWRRLFNRILRNTLEEPQQWNILIGSREEACSDPEAESKEKHGVWDPMPELTITSSYVHSGVVSSTFTMHGHGQPYARVDLNPMLESTLSPSQELWIWPLGITYMQWNHILNL